ncbi:hypothetical protein D6C86_03755 [Aureobasidium pullulans]|uniref:Tyrosine specific protein phosphatases domain-containing protein n=1 Tax=Aureobasidium pullulans TaxID=5580 RepID=A0A4S9WBZ9_AURPU|nr:hypothetical protein D6C94_04117 [Aureobasidium pullulans]THZ47512.1 hypothetical protein D6C87_01397 [Aureobasidium pullulans]THZ62435.1 hypothetical protein D6C86_03755 [Aureobasidium pullulans]THZ64031.1 hypothetical protein D6C88_08449 [Aureobasidium pullulans]
MHLELVKTLGCVVLRGDHVDNIARSSPPPTTSGPRYPYHVTILTKAESQQLNNSVDTPHQTSKIVERLLSTPQLLEDPIDLGVAIHGSTGFNVLFWPQGNNIRHQLGLSNKQFHITLTSDDKHDIDKGVNSITRCKTLDSDHIDLIVRSCATLAKKAEHQQSMLEVLRFVARFHTSCLSEISFDTVWRLLSKLSGKSESSVLACEYLDTHPGNVSALLRTAQCCHLPLEAKRAMCLYAQAADLLLPDGREAIVSQCVAALVSCSEHTEFGLFFLDGEVEDWKHNRPLYSACQKAFQNPQLRRLVQQQITTSRDQDIVTLIPILLSLASNQDMFTPLAGELYRLPRFFRWLLPFRLAVMSTPRCKEDITALATQNITLVVTLTEEEPLSAEWFADTSCRNVLMPVRNYKAPTVEQVDEFIGCIDILPIEQAALVHCGGGKGRAGTFAACYLMARGFGATDASHDSEQAVRIFPGDAIKLLRHMRPGSIETAEQESFIRDYAQYLISGRQAVPAPATPPDIQESQAPLELEGKLPKAPSTIVCCGVPGSGKSTFASHLTILGYTVISQDELGSRTACLNALSNAMNSGRKILIDRCNPYVEDREQLGVPKGDINHAATGPAEASANESSSARTTGTTTTASTPAERPFIHKFPRTRHLYNAGSATRDDLILTSSDAEAFLDSSDPSITLTIEEKVDGANLGISLDSSGNFKVQNRSHYVNSKSHAQFKKLDKWLEDHYEDLTTVLQVDEPGKWILYGEWLFAKHSIHYTSLPDMFLAFDLFDTEQGTFLSREALSTRLSGTNIHQVNDLELPETLNEQSLLDIVRSRQSIYYDGIVEGVYLRRQKDGKTIDRAKIVRSDFIAGDEHWNRRGITPNVVAYE